MSESGYFPGDDGAGPGAAAAGAEAPGAAWPDLDREGLLRRTFGDRDLARELLGLFEAQCLRLRASLLAEAGPGSRAEALHTLRGAALAVGAERVARLASGGDPDELLRALDDVVNVIRSDRGSP